MVQVPVVFWGGGVGGSGSPLGAVKGRIWEGGRGQKMRAICDCADGFLSPVGGWGGKNPPPLVGKHGLFCDEKPRSQSSTTIIFGFSQKKKKKKKKKRQIIDRRFKTTHTSRFRSIFYWASCYTVILFCKKYLRANRYLFDFGAKTGIH